MRTNSIHMEKVEKKGAFGPFKCLDINTLAFTMAIFSIAQDIDILILAKLNVATKDKL